MGPAVLRLAVGTVFIGHGAQKLLGLWGGAGLTGTAEQVAALGLAPAMLLAVVFGVIELAGGVALVLGAFTAVVLPFLLLDVLTFAWKAHLSNGLFLNWALTAGVGHGFEHHLVVAAALVCLMFTGAGVFSVDGHRRRSAEAAAAGLARIRAGKV